MLHERRFSTPLDFPVDGPGGDAEELCRQPLVTLGRRECLADHQRFDLAQRRGLGDPQQQLVYLRNLKAQIVCRNVADELDPLGVIAYQSSPAPGGFPVRKRRRATATS